MLERALADPFVKGFRRILHTVSDDISQGPLFRENVKRLSGTRLTFDIVMHPRQAPHALALAELAPGVGFILDHCGVPDIKGGDFDAWRRGISDLAARPNITAKISGIVAYADSGTWTAETLRPYVEHVIDRFGWNRVVWGSDWPVCTLGGGLLAWVAATPPCSTVAPMTSATACSGKTPTGYGGSAFPLRMAGRGRAPWAR